MISDDNDNESSLQTMIKNVDDNNEIIEELPNEKKRQMKDDSEDIMKFALDIDDGIISIPVQSKTKKSKKEKETIIVPNPTSVKNIEKSSEFITLKGTFPQILYQIIERETQKNIISWSEDGSSFFISDFTYFLTDICCHYFEKVNYTNFVRKLEKYGFQRIDTENLNANEKLNTRKYYHPKFQRDNFDVIKELRSKDSKASKKETEEPVKTSVAASSNLPQGINKTKCEQFGDLQIEGNDIIDNYERDHENERTNFFHDIQEMMFGFGDNWPPNKNATLLIDRLVTTYITELAQRAEIVAETTRKLDKECFLYLVRKDEFKFSKVMKLINANEQLKTIKKQDIDEEDSAVHDNADY